jgi:hypothetical protein
VWQVGGFLLPVSSSNKTDRHDTTQILLKVALNTISLNLIRTWFASHEKILKIIQILSFNIFLNFQGHYYSIGDCGMPVGERKCPQCNVTIGGINHLLSDQTERAMDMETA